MNQSIKAMYKKMHSNEIDIQVWWDFIATQDKAEVKQVVEFMRNVQERLKSYLNGFHYTTKIRAFCNLYGWSDVHPFEVVRVISPNCVEIRQLNTEQTVFPKQYSIGGFSAICEDNYNQEYNYISDPTRSTVRIRKGKNGWGGGKYRMECSPRKHYDYNF